VQSRCRVHRKRPSQQSQSERETIDRKWRIDRVRPWYFQNRERRCVQSFLERGKSKPYTKIYTGIIFFGPSRGSRSCKHVKPHCEGDMSSLRGPMRLGRARHDLTLVVTSTPYLEGRSIFLLGKPMSMTADLVALTSDRSPGDFIRHFVMRRLVEHPPYENPWTEESGWKSSSAESLQLDLPISWRGFSVCETRSNRPVGHPLFKRPSGDYWTVDGLLSLTLISSSWPHQAPKNTFSFLWSHSSEQHRLRAASFHYMAASR
jgi:hypothetical protein